MEEIAEKWSTFSSYSSTKTSKMTSGGRQLQLQDLPQEILERIFAQLTFRERIRAERVSRAWRALCQQWAWTRQRWIVCTREMLQIPEPRKHAEVIEQKIQELEQFQAESFFLRALLRRCGPHLLGLHLGPDIGVVMRCGRFFPTMTALAHLRVDEPLDEWHLRQIETHLTDRLVSLSIGTQMRRYKNKNQKMCIQAALASLLARCQRLECLGVDNLCDLFIPAENENEEEEEEKHEGGGGNVSDQQMKKRLEPIVHGTLRYLHTRCECDRVYNAECANQLRALLDKCPQLRYFLPVLWDNRWGDVDLEEELVEKLMSLQWPYVYSRHPRHMQLHPRLASLRALRLEPEDGVKASDLLLIADCCVQLEHLDVKLVYRMDSRVVPLRRQLEPALLLNNRLPRLCSLGFTIMMFDADVPNESVYFHGLSGDDGQQLDKTFLDILTQRNAIKPLRSLEIHHGFHSNCAHLDKENVLYVLQNMPHLETLSCPIDDWPRIEIGEFAGTVKATLDAMAADAAANSNNDDDSIEESSKSPLSISEKILFFQHFDHRRGYYCHDCDLCSVFKWRPGTAAEQPMEMTSIPCTSECLDPYKPERSAVLRDILAQTFDRNTRKILFGEII